MYSASLPPVAAGTRQQAAQGGKKLAETYASNFGDVGSEEAMRIWEQTAAGIARDLQMGLSVALPPLGVFERRLRPQRKGVVLLVEDAFLDQHGLAAADPRTCDMLPLSMSNYMQQEEGCPLMRFSMVGVSRAVGRQDKNFVYTVLSNMLECMGQIMQQDGQVVLSFAPLGEFQSLDGVILFHTARRRLPLLWEHLESTSTVQSVLSANERSRARPRSDSPRRSLRPSSKQSPGDELHQRSFLAAPSTQAEESSRTLQKSMPASSVEYPPLLESWSRTLAAAYVGAQDPGSPSHRIAASCSGAAAWLSPRPTPALDGIGIDWQTLRDPAYGLWKRRMHWWPGKTQSSHLQTELQGGSSGWHTASAKRKVAAERCETVATSTWLAQAEECGLSLPDVYQSLRRYEHYVLHGVPEEAVAPFNTMWLENILSSVRGAHSVQHSPAATVEHMLQEMSAEVQSDYKQAMKKAIVDHILAHDARARSRASVIFVPNPPQLWGSSSLAGFEAVLAGAGMASPGRALSVKAWSSARVRQALARSTQVALKLLAIWHGQGLDSLLLVDLPDVSEGLLHPEEFLQRQRRRREEVRQALEQSWLPAVAAAIGFWTSEPGCTSSAGAATGASDSLTSSRGEGGQEERYFVTVNSIAALLSTQAGGVVERSLRSYESFFLRFANEHPRTPMEVIHMKEGEKQEDAFLSLGLTSLDQLDVSLAFSTPLYDLAHGFVDEFSATVSSLRGLSLSVGDEQRPLWEVDADEPQIRLWRESIEEIIERNLHNVEDSLLVYDDYRHLLQEERRLYDLADRFVSTREEYMEQVNSLRATEALIREKCPSEIRLQLFSIECAAMNEELCKRAEKAVNVMLRGVLRNVLLKNDELVKSFEAAMNSMLKKPTTEEELVDLEKQLHEFRTVGLKALYDEFTSVCDWLHFIFECEDMLSWSLLHTRHFHAIFGSAQWVQTIDGVVREREVNLQREREALESKFKEQRNKFVEDLVAFNGMVNKFQDLGNLRQVEDYLERLEVLQAHFARAHAEAEKLNAKESRLGWEESSFPELDMGEQAIGPFQRLWTLASTLEKVSKQWARAPLFQLDPAKVEFEVRKMRDECQDLINHFREAEMATPASVAAALSTELGALMSTQVVLLEVLCNKSLQKRHWTRISSVVGFTIEADNSIFTLGKLIDLDIEQHLAELFAISEAASREYEIEVSLEELKAQWEPVLFTLHPWRQTGTYVVASACVEEVRALVEDQLLRTHSMSSSPFAAAWLKHLNEWQACLEAIGSLVQAWLRVQAAWTYLEPLFSGSSDLLRQMPTESRIFWQVDKVWRRFMAAAEQEKMALQVTRDEQLRQALQQCCSMVEQVMQGLNDYLEAKRLAFPRFFFLSNESLLQILAAGKDLQQVEKHLSECFPGISSLELSEDGQAAGMKSSNGECVRFPGHACLHRESAPLGAEEVFAAVQQAMRLATRACSVSAVLDMHAAKSSSLGERWNWVIYNPAQAASTAVSVSWVQEVQRAITSNVLADLATGIGDDVAHLASLLREQNVAEGRTPHLTGVVQQKRRPLEVVLCLLCFHREAAQDLASRCITRLDDFNWIAHLRHKLVGEPLATSGGGADQEPPNDAAAVAGEGAHRIAAEMAGAVLDMGDEYIGGASRLLITPLTSRAFLSLATAHHLRYHSLVEGPAGTGKTETVRELAHALAHFSVFLSCTARVEAATVSSYIKGMAATGAWLCIDNVQLARQEMLSNLSILAAALQQGLAAQMQYIELEGSLVSLHCLSHLILVATTCLPTLAVQLRTSSWQVDRIPASLLTSCRSISMIVPDTRLILEARFLAAGFADARAFASRIVLLCRMAQMSTENSQTAWWVEGDDSMNPDSLQRPLQVADAARRTLKALARAGHLEDSRVFSPKSAPATMSREDSDARIMQSLAIYRACSDILGPQVACCGEGCLGEAIQELMPAKLQAKLTSSDKRFPVVRERHREFMEEKGFHSTARQESKALELHAMTMVQSGVIVVGPSFSGKTTCIQSLAGGTEKVRASLGSPAKGGGSQHDQHGDETPMVRQKSTETRKGPMLVTLHPQACRSEEFLGSSLPEDGSMLASIFQALHTLTAGSSKRNDTLSNTGRLGLFTASQTPVAPPQPVITHDESRSSVLQFLADSKAGSPRHGRRHSLSAAHAVSVAPADETLEGEDGIEHQCWLHLDGALEPSWAECLHTLLDVSTRTLFLPCGLTLQAPPGLRLVFETSDLHGASPGTVSRCGIMGLFAPATGEGPGPSRSEIIAAWKTASRGSGLAALNPKERDEMQESLQELLHSLLAALRSQALLRPDESFSEPVLVKGVLSWLSQLLWPLKEKSISDHICQRGAYAMRQHLHACVMLACIWGIGNVVARSAAQKCAFDAVLRDCLDQLPEGTCPALPDEGKCFDYSWDDEDGCWCQWLQLLSMDVSHDLTSSAQLASLLAESFARPLAEPKKGDAPEQLFVHTASSSPFLHLAGMACHTHTQLLLCGPRGVGKTSCIAAALQGVEDATFHMVKATFSASTGASDAKAAIGGALEERRQGVRGPPLGMSAAMIFIDDLSLPLVELGKPGESALELVREFCCERGWYDRRESSGSFQARPYHYERLVDCFAIATGGPSTWKAASPRLLRSFEVLIMEEPDVQDSVQLFSALAGFSLKGGTSALTEDLECISTAAAVVLERCKSRLLPTPSRPQCAYSMADLAKIVAGISLPSLMTSSVQAVSRVAMLPMSQIAKLLVHECVRVLSDRLSAPQDRAVLTTYLAESTFEAGWSDEMRADVEQALANGGGYYGIGFDPTLNSNSAGQYMEFKDLASAQAMLQQRMEMLAELELSPERPYTPRYFAYTTEHILRIIRATRLPSGHLLLLGHAGTGRAALARLATHMAGQTLVERSLAESSSADGSWLPTIRKLLHRCQEESPSKTTSFLVNCCTEAQDGSGFSSIQLSMLGVLYSLITSSEVAGLMTKDEKARIVEVLREQTGAVSPLDMRERHTERLRTMSGVGSISSMPPQIGALSIAMPDEDSGEIASDGGAEGGADAEAQQSQRSWAVLRQQFVQQCLQSMRLLLLFPTEASSCRRLLRHFPSLLHLCSIDYFDEWPEEALFDVAQQLLSGSHCECPNVEVVNRAMVNLHLSAVAFFRDGDVTPQLHSYNVSPLAFFTFVDTALRIMDAKMKELRQRVEIHTGALASIEDLRRYVGDLGMEIMSLSHKHTFADRDKAQWAAKLSSVETSLEELKQSQALAHSRSSDAQEELRQVSEQYEDGILKCLDLEEQAHRALRGLRASDIDEIIASSDVAKEVVAAIANLLPAVVLESSVAASDASEDSPQGAHDSDRLLQRMEDGHFSELASAESQDVWEQAVDAVAAASDDAKSNGGALSTLHGWLQAATAYHTLSMETQARQAAVEARRQRCSDLTEELSVEEQNVAEAEEELQDLEEQFSAECKAVAQLNMRIERAEKLKSQGNGLLEVLSKSELTWEEELVKLKNALVDVHGDALLAAVAVTHLGAVSSSHRAAAVKNWMRSLTEAGCRLRQFAEYDSMVFTEYFLGMNNASAVVQTWASSGLPHCPCSLENAVVAVHSERPALCVDPDAQATKWLLNMERMNRIEVVSAQKESWLPELKKARREGRPALLQDIGDNLPLQPLQSFLNSVGVSPEDNLLYAKEVSRQSPHGTSRLYLATRLRRPRFPAELFAHVVLLDFSLTPSALEHLLLQRAAAFDALKMALPPVHSPLDLQSSARTETWEDSVLLRSLASAGELLSGNELLDALAEIGVERQAAGPTQARPLASNGSIPDSAAPVTVPLPVRLMAASYFALQALGCAHSFYQYPLQRFLATFLGACQDASGSGSQAEERHRRGASACLTDLERTFSARLLGHIRDAVLQKDRFLAAVLLSAHRGLRQPSTGKLAVSREEAAFLAGLLSKASAPAEASEGLIKLQELSQLPAYVPLGASLAACPGGWSNLVQGRSTPENEMQVDKPSGLISRVASLLPSWWMMRCFQQILVLLCVERPRLPAQGLSEDTRSLMVSWCEESLGKVGTHQLLAAPDVGSSCGTEVAARLIAAASRSILVAAILPGAAFPLKEIQAQMAIAQHSWGEPEVVPVVPGQPGPLCAAIKRCKRLDRWAIVRYDCCSQRRGGRDHLKSSWKDLAFLLEGICEEMDDGESSEASSRKRFKIWLTISGPMHDILSLQLSTTVVDFCSHLVVEAPVGIHARLASLGSLEAGHSEQQGGQRWVQLVDAVKQAYGIWTSLSSRGFPLPYHSISADAAALLQHCHAVLRQGVAILGDADVQDMRPSETLLEQAVVQLASEFHLGGHAMPLAMQSMAAAFTRALAECRAAAERGPNGPNGSLPHLLQGSDPEREEASYVVQTSIWAHAFAGSSVLMTDEQQLDEAVSAAKFVLEQVSQSAAPILQQPPGHTAATNSRKSCAVANDWTRFKALLSEMRSSAEAVIATGAGEQPLNEEIEAVARSLAHRQLPGTWSALSPLSQFCLGSYLVDIIARFHVLGAWMRSGAPPVIWMSAFFSISAFLTAHHADVARGVGLSIEEAVPSSIVMQKPGSDGPESIQGGAAPLLIQGLFLDHCSWDATSGQLQEAAGGGGGQCHACPTLQLTLSINGSAGGGGEEYAQTYSCPLFVLRPRCAGVIHGSKTLRNFVAFIALPSAKDTAAWLRQGVAALSQEPQ